jgi:hypothetical protein
LHMGMQARASSQVSLLASGGNKEFSGVFRTRSIEAFHFLFVYSISAATFLLASTSKTTL